MPIECISHVALNGAPFTCQAVAALPLTTIMPVIDFMVINIIVIIAALLVSNADTFAKKNPYIFRHAVESKNCSC